MTLHLSGCKNEEIQFDISNNKQIRRAFENLLCLIEKNS